MATKKYDDNTDYMALMQAAAASGDNSSAASYEQLRNQKIRGNNLNYAQTHDYESYLNYDPDTDYNALAQQKAAAGDWQSAYNALYGETNSRAAKLNDYSDSGTTNDNLWGDIKTNYGYTYESAPSAVAERQAKIDALTDEILNRGTFSYDETTDPLYNSYKKTYTREGNRAMQDTLGAAAANTGGVASSYAVSAANQAYNNYMSQLSDIIPELYQLAYSKWQDEGTQKQNQLSILQNQDDTDYNRGLNTLNFNTTKENTAYERQKAEEQTAYERQKAEEQTAYEREQDARTQAEEHAATMAQYGDFSGYKALGYTDSEIATMKAAWDAAQLAAASSRSSGSSSSSKKTSDSTSEAAGGYAAAKASNNFANEIAKLAASGATRSKVYSAIQEGVDAGYISGGTATEMRKNYSTLKD